MTRGRLDERIPPMRSCSIALVALAFLIAASANADEPDSPPPAADGPTAPARDFRRLVDVTGGIAVSTFYQVCLEGHPIEGLAVEGCWGFTELMPSFGGALKYRWMLGERRGAFDLPVEMSLGPSLAATRFDVCLDVCFDDCVEECAPGGWSFDLGPSFEAVTWITSHLGIKADISAGLRYLFLAEPSEEDMRLHLDLTDRHLIGPSVRAAVGMAF